MERRRWPAKKARSAASGRSRGGLGGATSGRSRGGSGGAAAGSGGGARAWGEVEARGEAEELGREDGGGGHVEGRTRVRFSVRLEDVPT